MKHILSCALLAAVALGGCASKPVYVEPVLPDFSSQINIPDVPKLDLWQYENVDTGLVCMKPSEHQVLMMNFAKMNVYSAMLRTRLEVLQTFEGDVK